MKVELFGYKKTWNITDDDRKEFTAHETYNANLDWTGFEVYDDEGEEVTGKKVDEILKAVKKSEE